MIEHGARRGRVVLRHIAPAAVVIITVRKLDGVSAVRALGVDVRPACEQLINHVKLAGHDCPMDGLVGPLILGVHEHWIRVEQAAYPAEVARADRLGDDLPAGGTVLGTTDCGFQELFHLGVNSVAGHLEQVAKFEVGAMLKQVGCDGQLIFTYGE